MHRCPVSSHEQRLCRGFSGKHGVQKPFHVVQDARRGCRRDEQGIIVLSAFGITISSTLGHVDVLVERKVACTIMQH